MNKDFNAEFLPDRVINAIKFTKNAKRAESPHLAHFEHLTRVANQVTLTTSCYKTNLRDIIGKRGLVRELAPKIIQ